ncbi:hypothetical protein [Polyangium fumosum]|uniref:Uncharacterized protein n=1 Tax=Polyangium fumosum TaxID=889272 RepID=A0A4U1J8F2_9BACT|nr:hypothetical protein [Polyangium fumosum]TKD03519.1 hypothetical protein E8A74_25295 [Polyangium fumosum]
MSDELNPYAPPEAGPGERATKKKKKQKRPASDAIAEALARLNRHIDDASAVAVDQKEAGGRLRGVTVVFVALAVAAIVSMILAVQTIPSRDPAFALLIIFPILFGILAVALVAVDLTVVPRGTPARPEATLRSFLKAMTMGRQGYAWACLSPTARAQTVVPPILGEIPIGSGSFSLATPSGLKDWSSTFIRIGHGQIRSVQVKRVSIAREDGDVAEVEVHAIFQAWPQWANIVAAVAFVVIRLLGALLYLVLFLALRKRHEVTFRKTLLRGKNGLWYVYAGDFFENETAR